MWRAELLHRLADYASALNDGLVASDRAAERDGYLAALAFVGRLLAAINDDASLTEIHAMLDVEEGHLVWNLLASEDGRNADEVVRAASHRLRSARRALAAAYVLTPRRHRSSVPAFSDV